jgi:hypothetical protein
LSPCAAFLALWRLRAYAGCPSPPDRHLLFKSGQYQGPRGVYLFLSHQPQHLSDRICFLHCRIQTSNLLLPLLSLLLLQPPQLFDSSPLFLPLLNFQLFNLFIQHDFLLHQIGTVGFQFGDLLEGCCDRCFLFFLYKRNLSLVTEGAEAKRAKR